MDSQVKSQITDKVYQATLDDLYELDQGLEVDLYKLNVFNKDIMIAPGKVMTDAKKDVHYCYVYVIKDGKVAAKLGIYETQVKRDEVYDLTDFEGREFLLFDHYYNEPGTLVEYEMKEETDNIFDYLKRFIKPTNNATATIKEQAALIKKISKKMGESEYTKVLPLFKKQKPYDEEWLDSLKEERENWMIILIILEVLFDIKFIFEDSDGSEDELREMVRSKPNTSTTVITVNLEETPRHITPVPKKSAPKYKVESESESDDEPVGEYKESMPEEKPKAQPKAETKSPRSFTSKAESKSPRSFSSKPPKAEPKAPTLEAEPAEVKPKSFSSKTKQPSTPVEVPKSNKPSTPVEVPKSNKPSTPVEVPDSKTKPELEAEPSEVKPRSFSSKPKPEPSQAAEAAPAFRKIPGTLRPRVKVRTVPPPPKESPPKNETKNNP
jgi:hypothetical protein